MRIERIVVVSISKQTAEDRATGYLVGAGYTRNTDKQLLNFHRGSWLSSLFAFTPQNWGAKVTFHISEQNGRTKAMCAFEINTFGQLVTEKERRFWESEADAFEAALKDDLSRQGSGRAIAESARSQNIVTALFIIIFSLAVFFASLRLFNSVMAGVLGLIVGAALSFLIAGAWLHFESKKRETDAHR